MKSVDDAKAKAVKGVRQIVRLDDAVAVVADHMGAAKKGLAALVIEWDDGPHAKLDTQKIVAELDKATLNSGAVAQNIGDIEKAMATAVTKVEATYQVPFLAHATMEPMNCTVHVRKDGCEIWVGSQAIARAQATAAKTTGLPLEKVVVHNHLIGGGFGRRLEIDGVTRAVQIAMQVDGPVKVVWTREEDIQHDMYRPYFFDRISAGLDEKGMPVAWNHRFAGSSIIARWLPPGFNNGLDPDTTEGAIDLVYALPNLHVEYLRVEPPGIPTAFWRSVGPSHNVFVTESFMDELAVAAKQDPVAYRRALLDKAPRAKAVLELAAEKAGWGKPLPQGVGRGVSVQFVFATYLAQVAEVEVSKDGAVRVRRVVCAVDCGTVVNPDTVRAQIQSAIIFGITAALHGEITLKGGRVEQSNFHDYLMLRMNEAPAIEVYIVNSVEPPGGMGEAGTSAIAPAVTNAIFAATGNAMRKIAGGESGQACLTRAYSSTQGNPLSLKSGDQLAEGRPVGPDSVDEHDTRLRRLHGEAPSLLPDQRNLQVRGPVLFLVESATVYVAGAPEQHVSIEVDEVVLHEVLPFREPERCERLAEDALRLVYFPFVVAPRGNLVEQVGEAGMHSDHFIGLVRYEVDLLCTVGDGMSATPEHVAADVDTRHGGQRHTDRPS